jgi:arylsulfatase A-like enzyme
MTDPPSAAWKTIFLGTATAGFIVALDRARVTAALAPAFVRMSAAEHVTAVVVATAGLAVVLTSVDLVLYVTAGRARRVVPPIAIGTAAGLYGALTIEAALNNAFRFEILGTTGFARIAWAAGLIASVIYACVLAWRFREHHLLRPSRPVLAGILALAVCAGTVYGALMLTAPGGPSFTAGRGGANVLVIAFDGVSADRTSTYGAARDTSPHLTALASRALIAENALPNACSTYGSVTALLTGRSPLAVHMAYFPDRLVDEDAFLHLPGILARHGYRTAVIGAEDYVDASSMGQRGGLTVVNHLGAPVELPGLSTDTRPFATGLRLWAQDLALRVELPVLHAFGALQVASFEQRFVRRQDADSDEWRVRRFEDHVIASGPRPWFAYVHLMGTHGPTFNPRTRRFSAAGHGRAWDMDEADDALRDTDARLGETLTFLRARGQLDRTLVAVISDHAERTTCGRVPFVIRFPGGGGQRRIRETLNLTDLAPSVLGALGIPVPRFMEGVDLGRTAPDPGRLTIHPWQVVDEHATPPGRNLVSVAVRRCDTAWIVPLAGGAVRVHTFAGFRGTCPALPPLDAATARKDVLATLRAAGWPAPIRR